MLTGWIVAAMVAPAAADPLERRHADTAATATTGATAAVDAADDSVSPASLRRIRRALSAADGASAPDTTRALSVVFEVHVVGAWPVGALFQGTEPGPGAPAPHGPPTHDDLLWLWAPWPGGQSMALAPSARGGWRLGW
jgi:hypothetical protein